MISNKSITYYHKTLDINTRIEKWDATIFQDVWVFNRKNSIQDKGYENSNAIDVRIPMELVTNTDIFSIGDIIAIGEQKNITKQTDLKNVEFYNVTSININDFGNNPHIHLGGK